MTDSLRLINSRLIIIIIIIINMGGRGRGKNHEFATNIRGVTIFDRDPPVSTITLFVSYTFKRMYGTWYIYEENISKYRSEI